MGNWSNTNRDGPPTPPKSTVDSMVYMIYKEVTKVTIYFVSPLGDLAADVRGERQ